MLSSSHVLSDSFNPCLFYNVSIIGLVTVIISMIGNIAYFTDEEMDAEILSKMRSKDVEEL